MDPLQTIQNYLDHSERSILQKYWWEDNGRQQSTLPSVIQVTKWLQFCNHMWTPSDHSKSYQTIITCSSAEINAQLQWHNLSSYYLFPIKQVKQLLEIKCTRVGVWRYLKQKSWVYFFKDWFPDDMEVMSLILNVLVPLLSLIFIAEAVTRVVNVSPVEVVVASKEASMVMVTSISQTVESICCSASFILANNQDCKVDLDDFHCVIFNCLWVTNLWMLALTQFECYLFFYERNNYNWATLLLMQI